MFVREKLVYMDSGAAFTFLDLAGLHFDQERHDKRRQKMLERWKRDQEHRSSTRLLMRRFGPRRRRFSEPMRCGRGVWSSCRRTRHRALSKS